MMKGEVQKFVFALLTQVDTAFARLLLFIIQIYKWTLSPWMGQQCRYYPTCSSYAAVAIREHGGSKGAWLAAKRICRCHPFSEGGIDEVPPKSCTKRHSGHYGEV